MPETRATERTWLPTALGAVAIVLWGTTIAVSRRTTEQLGTFTSGAVIYLTSGLLGCSHLAATRRLGGVLTGLPRKYLLGCGGLMVAYTILLYAAVGFAASPHELIAVTVANYLWPGLTLVFSVMLLGYRARRWLLAAGIGVSTVGVACAVGGDAGATMAVRLSGPVVAALLAAVAWGLYSNLSRRWASQADRGAMPVFLLATGLCLLLIRLAVAEASIWSLRTVGEVGYMAVFPTLLAYTFWDRAVRAGNMVLVAALSYLTPLLSVWSSSLYLGIPVSPVQWLASLLVVGGAVCCKLAVR